MSPSCSHTGEKCVHVGVCTLGGRGLGRRAFKLGSIFTNSATGLCPWMWSRLDDIYGCGREGWCMRAVTQRGPRNVPETLCSVFPFKADTRCGFTQDSAFKSLSFTAPKGHILWGTRWREEDAIFGILQSTVRWIWCEHERAFLKSGLVISRK